MFHSSRGGRSSRSPAAGRAGRRDGHLRRKRAAYRRLDPNSRINFQKSQFIGKSPGGAAPGENEPPVASTRDREKPALLPYAARRRPDFA
jgi:hypothetical protein